MHMYMHIHVWDTHHVQFIKENNMNKLKVVDKSNAVDQGVAVVNQIRITEGTLNTLFF